MTDTAHRPAGRGPAAQAAARVTPGTDPAGSDPAGSDFLPLNGLDHVEFWVGNARQAAAYYRALWGFGPVAFAGLETKIRDRASYVMVQNDIRFVLTAPLTPEGEIAEHVRAHGDGVHDIAFAVDDVESAWRETTARGAASALDPDRARRWRGRRPPDRLRSAPTATRSTRSSTGATTTASSRPATDGSKGAGARRAGGLSLLEVDHFVGNVGLGRDGSVGRRSTAT